MTHPDADSSLYADQTRDIASALLSKGVLTHEEIEIKLAQHTSAHPGLGARLVARAWTDPRYRERLLADGKAAAAEFGIDTSAMTQFDVLENTAERHHVIVCTLCSCYPRPILGEPPAWYTSAEYRGRVVREPRAVLAEFGLELDPDVDVVVMDSTADRRLMILPMRPPGTGEMAEEQLVRLITRDSMIGVGQPLSASQGETRGTR